MYRYVNYVSLGLMASLGNELSPFPGIHLTSIHPYQIQNDMFAGMTVRSVSFFSFQYTCIISYDKIILGSLICV